MYNYYNHTKKSNRRESGKGALGHFTTIIINENQSTQSTFNYLQGDKFMMQLTLTSINDPKCP